MNYIKFISAILIFSMGFNLSAQAQSRILSDEQIQQIESNSQAFEEELNITKEQEAKFDAINTQHEQDLIAIYESTNNRYQKIREIKTLTVKRNKAYEDVFTKEQIALLKNKSSDIDKTKKAQSEKMENKLDRFMKELNLTEDQKDIFQTIQKSYIQDLETLEEYNDFRLSKIKTAKKLMSDKNESIKAFFSVDQYDLFLSKQAELNEWMKSNSN